MPPLVDGYLLKQLIIDWESYDLIEIWKELDEDSNLTELPQERLKKS